MAHAGHRRPLIGRETEAEVLRQRLASASQGEGGVALVAGEPGIGKTRLLAEVAERASAVGWAVLGGRASDSEGMPPYLPFLEALRAFLRAAPPDRLRAQLGSAAAEVALLLPELHDHPGSHNAVLRPRDGSPTGGQRRAMLAPRQALSERETPHPAAVRHRSRS